MPNQKVIKEYSNSIKNLKQQWIDSGKSEQEFEEIYFQCLADLESTGTPEIIIQSSPYSKTMHRLALLVLIISVCAMYNFKTIYSVFICNIQEYIYPGFKLLRKIFIPLLSLFPSLTDFYHETCLIQNPFFTVVDMDCWPCSTTTNVMEVDDPKPVSQLHNSPFIYKTDQQVIDMEALQEVYLKGKDVFDKESSKILKNNKYYQSPQDLFDTISTNDNDFYVWKFNNIKVAKLLRQVIQRPKIVPKFGQSTERFILVHKSQEPLHVPDTECNFSFLLALSGSREISLLPAEECRQQCKALKVELKETYLLWYNWWYWRPAVLPPLGNQTFIAHMGSYC